MRSRTCRRRPSSRDARAVVRRSAAAHSLGLDRPVWQQYVTYISGLAHGDFGISYASRQEIGPAIITYLPATLELVFYSFVIYAMLGVGMGMVWAWRGNRPDHFSSGRMLRPPSHG